MKDEAILAVLAAVLLWNTYLLTELQDDRIWTKETKFLEIQLHDGWLNRILGEHRCPNAPDSFIQRSM